MPPKTSQLQIRVTPAEKAALKRLAREAGESLSSYVLSRALPRDELVVARLYERLADPQTESGPVLSELARALAAIPGSDLPARVPHPGPDTLSPVILNMVAALAEGAAHAKGAPAPAWTAEVGPLPRPHFGWALPSLKPHQLRVTPVPFKRRNLFFDPAAGPSRPWVSPDAGAAARPEAAPAGGKDVPPPDREPSASRHALADLGTRLRDLDTEVEFYFVHGAVLSQAFAARPPTAHVDALFRPVGPVRAAIADAAEAHGLPQHWIHEAVHHLVHATPATGPHPVTPAYVDLPGVRAFAPVPEYVLAIKCAALRLGGGREETGDLRYLMRALNLHTLEDVMDVVHRYFTARQLTPGTEASIRQLLS